MDVSGTAFGGSPTFTDITAYVMTSPQESGSAEVDLTWGRQDWFSTISPSTFSMTLRNIDGRFTPGRALLADGSTTNPYFPNVKYGTRMRIVESIASIPVNMADGYITDVTAVPANGTYWTVQINCTDIFGRMGTTTPFRGFVIEEMMLDHPSCLYPLQEAEGAQSFGDLSANLNPPAVIANSKYGAGVVDAGETPTGTGLLYGTAVEVTNSAFPAWTTGASAGSWLSFPSTVAGAPFTVEVWCQTPTVLPTVGAAILDCTLGISATAGFTFVISGTGHPSFQAADTTGNFATVTDTQNICDGNFHQFVGEVLSDNQTVAFYVDGVSVGTTAAASTFGAFTPVGTASTLGIRLVNGQPELPLTGAFAYAAMFPTALSSSRVANHYHAGSIAFNTDSTDQMIRRLLLYRPATGHSTQTGSGTTGGADITGVTELDAFLAVAAAEGSVIYADGAGVTTFLNRSNNFNPVAAVTLDAALGQVDIPTTWVDTIQNVVNDMTVSHPQGADQRITNAASVAQNGWISQSITANVATDAQALDLAGFAVAQGTQDQLGIPTLTVDIYALCSQGQTAQALAVLQLAPLDAVTVTNIPGVPPASTMTVQVQGGSYTRTSESFSVSLYCTPLPPNVVTADGTIGGVLTAGDTCDSASFVCAY